MNLNFLPRAKDAYLVGGAVRDILLGKIPDDFDIAVLKNPKGFAKKIASAGRHKVVEIGKGDYTVFRAVLNKGFVDVAQIKGDSIKDDLGQRDFTINAMARSLLSGELIDPLGGLHDIKNRKISMVSDEGFINDPLRLLRAFRFGAALDFKIDAKTMAAIGEKAKLIKKSAGERVGAEFRKLLGSAESYSFILQMADTGLLFEILPELEKVKGCRQNKYHSYDVYEHTMKAFYHLEDLFNNYYKFFSELEDLAEAYPDKQKKVLLKIAILLHDTGKPSSSSVDKFGNIHFYGHEKKSADMAKKICRRLRLSNLEKVFIDFIIRSHIQPLNLFTGYKNKKLTKRGITRFFMKSGELTPYLIMHSMADAMGKREDNDNRSEEFIEFAKKLMIKFRFHFKPKKMLPTLVTGRDLIDTFDLSPSPVFQTILRLVEEARLTGGIEDKAEAFILIKKFLEKNP